MPAGKVNEPPTSPGSVYNASDGISYHYNYSNSPTIKHKRGDWVTFDLPASGQTMATDVQSVFDVGDNGNRGRSMPEYCACKPVLKLFLI